MSKVEFHFLTSQEAERIAQFIETVPGGGKWAVLRVWNHVEIWRVDGDLMTASDLIQIGELMIRQTWKLAS